MTMTMTCEDILTVYETVADLTGQMLVAATDNEWDQLVLLEKQCSDEVKVLRANEGSLALSGAARQRKVEIIKKVLADDRRIRDLTMPWMAQLSKLIQNNGTQRRLASAYGAY
jgi:flagellar protein FliT